MTRVFDQHQTVPVRNRHEGGPNVSAYVSDPGVDDPAQIRYRDIQLVDEGGAALSVIPAGDWAPGGDYYIPQRGVGIVACATEQIAVALGAAYTNVTFWMQLRVSEDGIENDSVDAPQRITVDASQDASDTIDGTVFVTGVDRRDAGGLRVRFEWSPTLTGIQPTQFRLTRTAGPTTPADVSVVRSTVFNYYTIDVSSLQDAGAYTFNLIAENGATAKTVATVNFTADATGPEAVGGFTTEAC